MHSILTISLVTECVHCKHGERVDIRGTWELSEARVTCHYASSWKLHDAHVFILISVVVVRCNIVRSSAKSLPGWRGLSILRSSSSVVLAQSLLFVDIFMGFYEQIRHLHGLSQNSRIH